MPVCKTLDEMGEHCRLVVLILIVIGNYSDRRARPMTGGGPRLVVPTLVADWLIVSAASIPLRRIRTCTSSRNFFLELGGEKVNENERKRWKAKK